MENQNNYTTQDIMQLAGVLSIATGIVILAKTIKNKIEMAKEAQMYVPEEELGPKLILIKDKSDLYKD